MSSLLEKSLDEIIGSSSKGPTRPSHRGGRGARGNSRSGGHRGARPFGGSGSNGKATEIKVTNLHPDLTAQDLGKLMETIGPVVQVDLKFNTLGKSTGVAYVEFESSRDAREAIRRFDGRLAAGQIINVSTTMSLLDRIGGRQGQELRRERQAPKSKKNKPKAPPRKSLEDLDNELLQYMNGAAPVDAVGGQPAQEQAQGQTDMPVPADGAAAVPAVGHVEDAGQGIASTEAHEIHGDEANGGAALDAFPVANNDVAME
ncbi:hypothetical protein JL09_g3102 [Pichia kudriavzevii]|uniref:RRM domain-containing protein n=1 Tax=Pichia kudriavzevii TaxID=4909 RepID=A0A099NY38_PICKU|nr:hypothetical protein JL09_g3102 [Pichia kudriavzevii]